jgi:transcription initiation factor TFIID subunit 7
MEQYLLQVPRKLAEEIRKGIANADSEKIELISAGKIIFHVYFYIFFVGKGIKLTKKICVCIADNKHFTFKQGGREYFAKIAQLPCILETHKTYDDNLFYKSGEIGQIFIVTDNEEEKKEIEECNDVPNGITPPTTNIVKRTFEKTKSQTPYPKNEVARVEESLIKISQGGAYEDVRK